MQDRPASIFAISATGSGVTASPCLSIIAAVRGQSARMNIVSFTRSALAAARSSGGTKRVAFAEGEEQKIIRAAYQIQEEGIATPVLIGRQSVIDEQVKNLGLDYRPQVVDPATFDKIESYHKAYHDLRQRKGVTSVDVKKFVSDPNILGSLMVKMGDADAFISGLTYDYPEVIRPSLPVAGKL